MQTDLLQPAPARVRKSAAPAVKRESMHGMFKRLDEQRRANDGHLVPRPPEDVFLQAGIDREQTATGSEIGGPNAAMHTIENWFKATFDAGGTAQDLLNALGSWTKPRQKAKQFLRDKVWDALHDQARRRDGERAGLLAVERLPYEHRAHARESLRRAEHEQHLCEKDLQQAKGVTAQSKTALAQAEAAVVAFEAEYGAIDGAIA